MRRIKLVLAVCAVMVAMLVATAAPAMAVGPSGHLGPTWWNGGFNDNCSFFNNCFNNGFFNDNCDFFNNCFNNGFVNNNCNFNNNFFFDNNCGSNDGFFFNDNIDNGDFQETG